MMFFYWDKNIFTAMSNTPSTRHEAEKTYITAELISITEDGCGSLKFGNPIIFISLKNENKDLILPSFVEISAIQIILYPTNT
ncbi:hypothetical protein QLG12_07900 [Pseudomonas sp. V88_4]|uniref:hypothetical protein n=1 Tax=Pseudomonas sp. V88_4 TaxID=3044229 RepID=UPI00249ED346|nr:hypothetical protein [Pseudomonas sp. V88_4]MDI3398122.1 hypothetical protein [Pseudomonas sp. V88_4]